MEEDETLVNYIWGFFIIFGIIYSIFTGNISVINKEIVSSTTSSVDTIFNLLPIMCLWLGLANIAKNSGLLTIITKKLEPLLSLIFKDIPKNHESFGLISSNIVMNMLGLGNAATPFGLKAMESMQKLNHKKDTATRSMITFLVINTSSISIMPTTVISFRLLNGSNNPTSIVLASIITTFLSTFIALIIDRLFYLKERKYDI